MKKAAGYLALFSTIAALSLSGCGTATKQEADSEAKADTYVTLKAITVGTMPENGMDEFYEELDDMTEELYWSVMIAINIARFVYVAIRDYLKERHK